MWKALIAKSNEADRWQQIHEEITRDLADGWRIQTSHAVADSTALVVYYYMTKIKTVAAPDTPVNVGVHLWNY